ncbi:unnamed protein product [Linum trigynum]|uniref:DUF4283 domain-containing protein n=1 Tax=Linum trigynum TaxID=586398 RepID=A0AAV2CZ49_9ROSI
MATSTENNLVEHEIERQLQGIRLEEEDEEPLVIDAKDKTKGIDITIQKLGLVGRLLASRSPNIKYMQEALSKAWNLKKKFTIKPIEENLFPFQFSEIDDRNRVRFGGPLAF